MRASIFLAVILLSCYLCSAQRITTTKTVANEKYSTAFANNMTRKNPSSITSFPHLTTLMSHGDEKAIPAGGKDSSKGTKWWHWYRRDTANWNKHDNLANYPLPGDAFTRMVVQEVTYTILGDNSPTSGIKVDVTKPEAVITGLFTISQDSKFPFDLVGFELKAGVTANNFTIWKGFKDAGTSYEFKPVFHRITFKNSAWYGTGVMEDINRRIVTARNEVVKKEALKVIDSLDAISYICNFHFDSIKIPPKPLSDNMDTKRRIIAIYLLNKILDKDSIPIGSDSEYVRMVNDRLKKLDTLRGKSIGAQTPAIVKLYSSYKKRSENLDDEKLDKMIANASELWTKKRYLWWTISPFIKADVGKEFATASIKDKTWMSYGASFNYNWYTIKTNQLAHLIRTSFSLSQSNNIATSSAVPYEVITPIYHTDSTITQSKKTGSAYKQGDIKSGFLVQTGFAYYLLPLKSWWPGIYGAADFNAGNLYSKPAVLNKQDKRVKVGVEAGTVLNVSSREKDKEKSLFSLLVYVRYDDLTDKREITKKEGIEKPEDWDVFNKRNWSFGIKVGIPITLPQRAK